MVAKSLYVDRLLPLPDKFHLIAYSVPNVYVLLGGVLYSDV